jgi:hypothetical protein
MTPTSPREFDSFQQTRGWLEEFGRGQGAFGNPEGKRADLRDLVDIDPRLDSGGLEAPADEQRVRVLVGRKGAGKTLYMRHMKDLALADSSVAVLVDEAEQTNLLQTRHVIQVAHWFSPSVLTEIWTQIWNRAALYSLLTYVLRSPRFDSYVTESERIRLEHTYKRFLRSLGARPRSIFTTARELINMHTRGFDLTKTLDDPGWDDIEQELIDVMADAPPIYFYLDAIDEDFAHAPMYWLRCQKGLFYHVMRLLRNSHLGGRLHLVICVRDVVLSSVYRSEHAPRYRNDPHIRVLNWGPQSIRFLLESKVRRLRPPFLLDPENPPSTFADWLGHSTIVNAAGRREPIDDYALRHTQLVPRDLVLLGNRIGEVVSARTADRGPAVLTEDDIRSVVSELALFGGLVQIELCANQLVSEAIPVEATRHEFLDFYTASVEYASGYADELLQILRGASGQRIGRSELHHLCALGERSFEATSDIASVLWQNGLLGYTDGDRDIFYSLDTASRFKLPVGAERYVFHPSLRECAGLVCEGRPVSAL